SPSYPASFAHANVGFRPNAPVRRRRQRIRSAVMSSSLRHTPRHVPTTKTGKSYLVVGGHGMLGSHMVEALLARGERRVKIFDRAPSTLFDDEVRRGLVTFHRGDIRDRATVTAACRDVDTVFHTAASVNYWADLPFELGAIHAVNAAGTENVVEACVEAGVRQLMFTSSSSVVVTHDLERRPI